MGRLGFRVGVSVSYSYFQTDNIILCRNSGPSK